MQSFLLGVPVCLLHIYTPIFSHLTLQEIVVGFRTPAGRLTTTQVFKTIEIPRMVRRKPGAWDPQICLSWGQSFLSTLKSKIANETSDKSNSTPRVWRVTLKPKEGVAITLLDAEGIKEVEGGEDRIGFLPRWYYDLVSSSNPPPSNSEPKARSPRPNNDIASRASESSHHGWNI